MAEIENKKKAEQEQKGGFKFSTIWDIVVLNWPWILLCAALALGAAHFLLRYRTQVYSHSMSILIKDETSKRMTRGNTLALESMGVISNTNGFDNELEILKSTSVNARTVKALHLYTSYHVEGRMKDVDIYNKQAPITVDMPESQLAELKVPIDITIHNAGGKYKVTTEYHTGEGKSVAKTEHTLASLPAEISTPLGTIMFQQNPNAKGTVSTLNAQILPIHLATRIYRSKLGVAPSNKTTTVAIVSMADQNSQRALDYLNELLVSYNEDANEDKNEVAKKTEEFIKSRIDAIRDELNEAEVDLEQYKRENELIDLSSTATRALSTTADYEKQQVELQTQINLIDALITYVNNPANAKQVIPVNLGLADQGLNNNIKEYNEYVMQRKRLLKSSSEDNPMVERATSYIEEMWPTIKLSLDAIRRDLVMRKSSADREYQKYSRRISNAPTYERQLNNKSQQQEFKAQLYLMLLQKQEENNISLASTASKARMINEPEVRGSITMGRSKVYLFALLLGIAFPICLILLRKRLRYSIEGRESIEELTDTAIIADIPLSQKASKKNENIVVHENTNDMMEESFRGLRTNLRFILDNNEKVIITTSCIPGEGKTFVSTNLALSLALMGKKVILMGLDIRKPRLVRVLNLPNSKKGITTFLTSDGNDFSLLDEQIYHGVINSNLDVLPAGIIPPNPGELISREQLDKAIEMLREHYDYIILDTPPVGLVSDTLSIARVADMTLFVCRADYSPRSNFEHLNDLAEEKLPKVNIVLNGVNLKKKKYGRYYGGGKYGSRYGKYYGKYAKYGHYGMYGQYGHYGSEGKTEHIEK